MARKGREQKRARRAQDVKDAAAKLKCSVAQFFERVAERVHRVLAVNMVNVPRCVWKFAQQVLGRLNAAPRVRFRPGRRERYLRATPALQLH